MVKALLGFHTGLKGFLVQDIDSNIIFFRAKNAKK